MLHEIGNDERFLQKIMFCDEVTFHVCGHVYSQIVRIWGAENPHASVECERSTPKVNVGCDLMHDNVISPFLFVELIVMSNNYLNMLELLAVPQFPESVIFQHDDAPPHHAIIYREFLDEAFHQR
ncbi:uncharacterized protein NPIL_170651 [Nephila pilipes]|uniref:Tc1-like transposase DDE domain-containing protein n=1 Tax=Nephila pilipes TaxID=299642 RepID=A0A8X6QGF9_NEPPI|nr:uncharacterized protein NPIL_170651 [Nephila pilipes]